ncbi:uncharacterized protein [Physcomitrium patens]|uniref:Uncharacterized protein n=1 Tax=Physcomitrium patens TaxID=3218 RepID=A0A2K1KVN7_PHYPA|nr:uncharacterized protein LOC112280579 [Physcomitrium patens]PNR57844.1 hypothetical protein PHYPA_004838 [Physcomitrium patens]|eukprot:XP_024371984.1 uncharacterized protein LOC112280579 [Physcomitrella patens]
MAGVALGDPLYEVQNGVSHFDSSSEKTAISLSEDTGFDDKMSGHYVHILNGNKVFKLVVVLHSTATAADQAAWSKSSPSRLDLQDKGITATPPTESEANRLAEIEATPRLRTILKEWEQNFNYSWGKIENEENKCNRHRSEIHQLIGYFSVFQGVVLTAVAHTSSLSCQTWWIPFTLSSLACLATLWAVTQKLRSLFFLKCILEKDRQQSQVLHLQIVLLKSMGKDFVFPKLTKYHHSEAATTKTGFKYIYSLVILFLVVFSSVFLISCLIILCRPAG